MEYKNFIVNKNYLFVPYRLRAVSCILATLIYILITLQLLAISQESISQQAINQKTIDGLASTTSTGSLRSLHNDTVRLKSYGGTQLDMIGEVTDIIQDPTGFIWVSGKNGLARWDGYQTKIYQHKSIDPTSLSTNSLNDLLIDSQGVLWVASFWGLNRYNASTDRFERFLHDKNNDRSLSHNAIVALLEDREGHLWVASNGGGLMRFNQATQDFDRFKAEPGNPTSLSDNIIINLAEDTNGYLWLAIKNIGVDIFDTQKKQVIERFVHHPNDPSTLSNNFPSTIARDAHGVMWVGTNWGLNRYLGQGQFKRYMPDKSEYSLIAGRIQKILCLTNGELWLATGNNGIARYNPKTDNFNAYLHAKEGRNIIVGTLYQDASEGIWLGFSPAGVARIDRYSNAILNYQHEPGNDNSLSNTDVTSIAEDKANNLWIGTRHGLNYFDRHKNIILRHKDNKDHFFSRTISALLLDDNDLWIGSIGGGLRRYNLKTQVFQEFVSEYGNPFSLSHQDVWTLEKSTEGDIWAGNGEGGVSRFNTARNDFTQYFFKPEHDAIAAPALDFQFDHRGDLWIASDDGLFRLTKDYQAFDKKNTESRELAKYDFFELAGHTKGSVINLRMPIVLVVVEDSNKRLWIGTEGDGLHYWDKNSNTTGAYRMRDGLVHNTIESIVEDDNGDIWVATGGGISRLNPHTHHIKNFTTDNGLPSNIFSSTAGLKTHSGEVAFGSTEGLIIINPKKVFTNNYIAPLVMTGFKLFNQEVLVTPPKIDVSQFEQQSTIDDYKANVKDKERLISDFTLAQSIIQTKEITLEYDQTVMTFEFALLNYDVPDKNEYAYKLEGFDDDWTFSGSRRSAGYTNLDSGRYLLRVKAANNEGIWLDNELTIKLTILPPWWATWWTYLLCVCVGLLLIIIFLYGQYTKRKSLEAKISERTKELELKNNELRIAYRVMEEASFSDPLTGLKNRRYFYNTIDADISKSLRCHYLKNEQQDTSATDKNLIFYLVDIDHFKSVNDTYGHNNGDIVLKQIAKVLIKFCRGSDLVIRWGGEEFLIVSRYVCPEHASVLAEKIRTALSNELFELDTKETITRTCSIGYACFPFDANSPDAINLEQTISIADWCLYRSKHNGRNRWTGIKQKNAIIQDGDTFINYLDIYEAKGEIELDTFGG
ncbi:two-component regulator propeller domain-containing protein [Marinagarivorans algicola]|uniref:two-component regulator propeller domain-containing protein n=1 Tax=Marinagarivorans algicola TaxID=1513270 RepID=UPI0037360A1E